MRLFVGIPLAAEVIEELSAVSMRLRIERGRFALDCA